MSDGVKHCKKFAHEKTIVIMDDTIYHHDLIMFWNEGPTKAWLEGIQEGWIQEIHHEDVIQGRGMSWGHYIMDT